MLGFILIGLWGGLVVFALMLLVIFFLLALDGRAALSLLNAKEQLSANRGSKILANVCFRLGVKTPLLYETSRFPTSVFFIQSSFHRGWLVVGQDIKRRLGDEELEVLFASVAIRKKVKEYQVMVPLSSLLMLLNLPIWFCERYQLGRLQAYAVLFWAPLNAIVAKVTQRLSLSQKINRIYDSSMGPANNQAAIWSKLKSHAGASIYQTFCLQPLALNMFVFEDPLLDVLFAHDKAQLVAGHGEI